MTAAEHLSAESLLRALQVQQHGVFLHSQAVALGWTPAEVKTQVRRGLWHRLGSGGFCLADGLSAQVLELRRAAARMLVVRATCWPATRRQASSSASPTSSPSGCRP